jgi:heme exporter protein D
MEEAWNLVCHLAAVAWSIISLTVACFLLVLISIIVVGGIKDCLRGVVRQVVREERDRESR